MTRTRRLPPQRRLVWRIVIPLSLLVVAAIIPSGLLAVWLTHQQFDRLVSAGAQRRAQALAEQIEIRYNALLVDQTAPPGLRAAIAYRGDANPAPATQVPIMATAAARSAQLNAQSPPAEVTAVVELRAQAATQRAVPQTSGVTMMSALSMDAGDGTTTTVARPDGIVVFTTGNTTRALTPEQITSAAPVRNQATQEVVGYVLVTSSGSYSLAQQIFLQSVTWTLVGVASGSAVVVIVVGWWIVQRATVPIRSVTRAAVQLAQRGEAPRLPITSQDELGEMSRAFNDMADALAAQQALRRRLIADVSHELRTPLSIIELELEGLTDGLQSPMDAAENIRRELAILTQLSGDISVLAQSDAGEFTLELQPMDYAAWLAQEVARWEAIAREKSITIRLLPCESPITVSGDTARLGQALGNLLQNALQHAPANTVITVRCTVQGNIVITDVIDRGPGISPDDLPYIFERFYRADRARQRVSGGRGLGLSIVRQIIKGHGGQVGVESEVDRGSRFRYTLPLSR